MMPHLIHRWDVKYSSVLLVPMDNDAHNTNVIWYRLFYTSESSNYKILFVECLKGKGWKTGLTEESSFSHSVVSDSLQLHESQHTRPPCPSPTPKVHSDSHPSSQWCHPAISSSVVPFSSCPKPLPASESFPVSQLFPSGGQSTGVSALASFLPKKSQGWSPSEWTGWISLQSKGLLQHHSSKSSILQCSAFFTIQLSHPYMTTGKTIALTRWTLLAK